MMLANDLKTYYDEVRRYLDCPKDEQDRLLLSVNKQVIELQVDNPNLDYDGIVEFLGEPESLAASLMERLSPDVIQKFRKRKRRIRTGIRYYVLCYSCFHCYVRAHRIYYQCTICSYQRRKHDCD